jgi:hypothetical protein
MSRRYNNRSTARLSRVQQIQAEEEQMQKQAIRDHNRQAYIARAQRRNQRKVPTWVRERDAQRRAEDAKKMEAGEFVIHVGNRRNRSRRNRQSLADHFPKQEETKIAPKPSRFAGLESDSDEEDFREDYPQLAAPTKKVLTPLGNWAAMAAKPAAKVAPEKPAFKTQRPAPVNTATKIQPAVRIASVAPEKDNSAWSDDEQEDNTPLHKDPKMFNADGTMKSWADLCDEESSDEEDW